MLKKRLNADEKYGLSADHIVLAEKYLRLHKTAGALSKQEAIPLYELFLLGYSIDDLNRKYPQYPVGKIALTAALNSWVKDREKLANSVYDRIKARIVRSTVEQVEFLTDMISVSATENTEEMRKYLADPTKTPPPQMRIKNIKEYQQVIEMLVKVTDSVRTLSGTQEQQSSPKLVSRSAKPRLLPVEKSEEAVLLERLVGDAEDE